MPKKRSVATLDSPDTWQLPTNHKNILFMLGSGLITGPKGFQYGGESKYYDDTLSLCPGWIPLFKKHIPETMLAMSTQASTTLYPAIAILNMADYRGEVCIPSATGGWETRLYADVTAEDNIILVPAPLPISWVFQILFKDETGLSAFRRGVEDLANIDISELQLLTADLHKNAHLSLMGQDNSDAVFSSFSGRGESDSPITAVERAQALGGIVAMLYQLANNSDLFLEVFKKARKISSSSANYDVDYEFDTDDPILRGLPYWLAEKNLPSKDLRAVFFFGLLEEIILHRESCTRNELTAVARNYVRNQLDTTVGLRDAWQAFPKLLDELSRPELTLSEQFEKFKGTVSHALLLFFQRERCDDLLKFQSQNPRVVLSDAVIIAAALLFGARDGWFALAKEYRHDISKWVTSLMAAKAQYSNKDAIQIKQPMPKPLREFFAGSAWDANEKHALEAARRCKWEECLQTKIKVPKSYCVEEGYLIFPGDVKGSAIKTVIDKDNFLTKLRDVSSSEKHVFLKVLGIAE